MCIPPYVGTGDPELSQELRMIEDLETMLNEEEVIPIKPKKKTMSRMQKQAMYGGRR